MLHIENRPLKTFRVTYHLREPMRPRVTRIVQARDELEAAGLVDLPPNTWIARIKQIND